MEGLCDHTVVSEFSGTEFLRTRNMSRLSVNLGCGCWDDPHSPHPQPCWGFSVYLQEIMQELKAWAWLNLEDFVLSEISQTQRDRPCMIPLISSTQSGQIHTEKVERWLSGAGGGNEELAFNGYRDQVCKDEKSSEDGWWWGLHNNIFFLPFQ